METLAAIPIDFDTHWEILDRAFALMGLTSPKKEDCIGFATPQTWMKWNARRCFSRRSGIGRTVGSELCAPLEFDADGNLRDYVARDFSPDSTG